MRRLIHTCTLLILMALTALPALAQDAEVAAPETFKGLGLMMVLIGLFVVAGIGFLMAQREASGDEDDLV